MNEKTNERVNTPFGLTKSQEVQNVVMQGETFGPLCCSVQVDKFGKECMDKEQVLYQYKGEVGVSPLSMVDDLVFVPKCGLVSVLMNAFINAKNNMKKLKFGSTKRHKMNVGKRTCYCLDLSVQNCEVKVVEDMLTGEKVIVDEERGEHTMETSDTEKYLGDLISNDGRNSKNI